MPATDQGPRLRYTLLLALVGGLLLAPAIDAGGIPAWLVAVVAAFVVAAPLLAGIRGLELGLTIAMVVIGCAIGLGRVAAIDSGAIEAPRAGNARAKITGHLAAVPRTSNGTSSLQVATGAGRVLVRVRGRPPQLAVGAGMTATGTLEPVEDWERPWLRRNGISAVLTVPQIRPTGAKRAGLTGIFDSIRSRAEGALGRGVPDSEAALARGFVLGQDERIDERTRVNFKRSGLAHLLAVSGQNVLLLVALTTPILALVGVPLRARLWALLAIVALYVPVAGAGPSIQRAGVMGAAGLVAALAERPASRWYAVGLAAAATLIVNPLAAGDVGWQLSFAAVIGILLWTRPLTGLLVAGRRGDLPEVGSVRMALAQGAAMTIAATVATAPLMAHHFETVSLAALPANVLVLPAVAPVMWIGMLVGFAGQFPFVPVEPLNAINAALIAYVEQIAAWFAAPGWALLEVGSPGPATTVAICALTLLGGWTLTRIAARRAGLGVRPRVLVIAALGGLAILAYLAPAGGGPASAPTALRVTFLDVGQGDAILLEPPGVAPILVDAGPPGAGIAAELARRGVKRLAWLLITHDQSDHAGGARELLEGLEVDQLGFTRLGRDLRATARSRGTNPIRLAEGSGLRAGNLELSVLWPPAAILDRPTADPNRISLVTLVRAGGFSLLLTGDAEAEAIDVAPGPLDVLKLAHHGSADAGLAELLSATAPRLAIASVGAQNPFGHPDPRTLGDLDEAAVPLLRTDQEGPITLEVDGGGWSVGRGS